VNKLFGTQRFDDLYVAHETVRTAATSLCYRQVFAPNTHG
jgi:hypothetical protein